MRLLIPFEFRFDGGEIEIFAERLYERGINKKVFPFVQFAVRGDAADNKRRERFHGVYAGDVEQAEFCDDFN